MRGPQALDHSSAYGWPERPSGADQAPEFEVHLTHWRRRDAIPEASAL